MFNVLVKKHIGSTGETDGQWKAFYRLIELPFAPSVGMSLSYEGWTPGIIESIHWDQNNGVAYFFCTVKTELPYAFNGYEYSFDYLCEASLGAGWLPFVVESEAEIRRSLTKNRDDAW